LHLFKLISSMKPLIKYRGGKSKEIPHLIKHIPQFNGRYIEPFFGGGALYFYLEPTSAIINDINSKLVSFYMGVKNDFDTLKSELAQIETLYTANRKKFDELKKLNPTEKAHDDNEALYYQLRDMFNGLTEKKYSDALLYFYINKTAYSGMIRYNAKGEFNVPYGRYPNLNTSLVTSAHRDLLTNTSIYNVNYRDIFEIMATQDDFMFLDPPYDCTFTDYGNTSFSEQDQFVLSEEFKQLKCKALMVIGKTPLTETLYREYVAEEYGKSYSVNIRNRFKAEAKHLLIKNY